MNYLEDWYQRIKEYKWSRGLHEGFFDQKIINGIYNNFKKFFKANIYTVSDPNDWNWLVAALCQKDFARLGHLAEISQLIDYYHKLRLEGAIKQDYSDLPIFELRNRLFELYTNLLLEKNDFSPNLNDTYVIDGPNNNAISKPVDSSFIFKGEKYIIECQKLYNSSATSLINIAKDVLRKTLFLNNELRALSPDVIPNGYIIFKTEKNIPLIEREIRDRFLPSYKKYLGGMGANLDVLIPTFTNETDNYKIKIESSIYANEKEHEIEVNKYLLSVRFKYITKDFSSNKGSFSIIVNRGYTSSSITDLIYSKIRAKIKQHNKSSLKKILFFELEENPMADTGISLYVPTDRLDYNLIQKGLSKNVSLVLVFKRYIDSKIICSTLFLSGDNTDEEIKTRFNNIELHTFKVQE